eukprot:3493920-Pyramimonas_sp.AAC.1
MCGAVGLPWRARSARGPRFGGSSLLFLAHLPLPPTCCFAVSADSCVALHRPFAVLHQLILGGHPVWSWLSLDTSSSRPIRSPKSFL